MSIVYCKKTRRQFIVGSGNTLLALPFLPSLFSSEALAQSAAANDRKMMIFMTDHNMVRDYWVNPLRLMSPNRLQGTREMMMRDFGSLSDINSVLSDPVLNSLRMNNQMTILRGLDMQAGVGHEDLSALGGSRNDICPTFDTIIEDSLSVYPSATTPTSVTKAIRIDIGQSGWLSYRKVGSTFQSIATYGQDAYLKYGVDRKPFTVTGLYSDVFKSLSNGTVSAADTTNKLKTNILNRVFGSYQSFKSNRKVSSDDIARLEQHMSFLSDLQNSLKVVTNPTMACSNPAQPMNTDTQSVYNAIYLDLLAVAFKCGLTKLGIMSFENQEAPWLPGLSLPAGVGLHGGMHGPIGVAQGTAAFASLVADKTNAHNSYEKYIYNTIASKFLSSLNMAEGSTGRTYLDNMLTAIVPKFGMEGANGGSGHGGGETQTMLFGSMGGRLKAGRYYSLPTDNQSGFNGYEQYMPHNALFVTLLDLMGVPKSEYEKYSNTGNGWGIYRSPTSIHDSSKPHPFAARFYDGLPEILT